MRSIHLHLRREYGKENVKIFCLWERIENKKADFSNHRFSLRCLSKDIILVSIRFRSNINTPNSCHIIKKDEMDLLNERIKWINNTLNMLKIQRDTCKNHLEETLDRESMEECEGFIKAKREFKHVKTLECQKVKFERLCQKYKKIEGDCSNIQHGDHDEITYKMVELSFLHNRTHISS